MATENREPLRVTLSPLALLGSPVDRAIVLELSGELDLASAPLAEEQLLSVEFEQQRIIVLDLRRLTFMDSTGIALIVRLGRRARGRGARLVVVKGPQQVQRILQLTGVDEHVEVVVDPTDIPADAPSTDGRGPSPDGSPSSGAAASEPSRSGELRWAR
jgi:anti-anti-sigma factor